MESTTSTLFLGDLSVHCKEDDIREIFQRFGQIEAIILKRGGTDKSQLSYGFIKFSNRSEAEEAYHTMGGYMLLGRALR
jgi:RNA recognition motif-containing protein